MPIRDSLEIVQIASTIKAIVTGHKSASTMTAKRWLNSLLNHCCRELEDFVEPRVSFKAAQMAEAMGLMDLRRYHWDHQTTKMKDSGRKIFHWDHLIPVSNLKTQLLQLGDPSLNEIVEICEKADIAGILKEENCLLDKSGFRFKRDNPLDCY